MCAPHSAIPCCNHHRLYRFNARCTMADISPPSQGVRVGLGLWFTLIISPNPRCQPSPMASQRLPAHTERAPGRCMDTAPQLSTAGDQRQRGWRAATGLTWEAGEHVRGSQVATGRAGYGGRVVAEMDKLKTMVRKTEDRQQLGELMALVAEKTTVAVAHKPDRTESKVHQPLQCISFACAVHAALSGAMSPESRIRGERTALSDQRMHGHCSPCTCLLPFEKSCRHCRLLQ